MDNKALLKIKSVEQAKSKDLAATFRAVAYKNGNEVSSFVFDREKILIGTGPHCDWILRDKSVGYYHACIILIQDSKNQSRDKFPSIELIDLGSPNGIIINNERQSRAILNSGDRILLGDLEYLIEETYCPPISFPDAKISQTATKLITKVRPVELPPVEGLTIIDGEYCDIVFKENPNTVSLEELYREDISKTPFIDFHDEDVSTNKNLIGFYERTFKGNIYKSNTEKSLLITVVVNNFILTEEYYAVVNGILSLGRRPGKNIVESGTVDEFANDQPFIRIDKDQINFIPIQGHSFERIEKSKTDQKKGVSIEVDSKNGFSFSLAELQNTIVVASCKGVRIFIRQSEAPTKIIPPPFFGRDKLFQKQALRAFGVTLLVSIILMLIRPPEQMPEEKVAVVYKRATKPEAAKHIAKNSNMDQDQGNRPEDMPNKENQQSKSGTPKEQNIAKTANAPKDNSAQSSNNKAVAPVKAYKLEISGGLNSFLSNNSTVATNGPTANPGNSMDHGPSGAPSKNLGLGKSSAEIGNFGSDAGGIGKASGGSKGLTSKNGSDLLYVEPKTVVLGSIDPDILRKILQEYLPQFRHCYQQELAGNSDDIKGVVDLNFRIDAAGKVISTNIKAKDARFSSKGLDCMAQVLKIINFPAPKGGGVVDVRQPLNFFAEKGRL